MNIPGYKPKMARNTKGCMDHSPLMQTDCTEFLLP
jgi:hypothetical protein